MRKGLLIALALFLSLVSAACNNGNQESNEAGSQNIKEKVHAYSVGTFEDTSASITSHELIVTQNGNKTSYDLPEDEFFVSIAPFMETTHECAIHSLTGCQGELVAKNFDVLIKDEQGNPVIDETMTSLENGFIDLWLPRDQRYQVTIEYDGKTAESEISTFKDSPTCITTMQLT